MVKKQKVVDDYMAQISVIVPVYNVEKYIHRCVESIRAQTLTNFELILIDDGSPDNCGKICDEYAEKDRRIHVIHKVNGGLSDARNAGIDWALEHSNSEWIAFIDSDDWIYPKYLEALYNAANETGCEISICGYEETTEDNPKVDESRLQAKIVNTEDFFCEHNTNAVIACAKLYRKELFREIRYPVGKLHEDEFTTHRVLFKTKQLAFLEKDLYFYFFNPNSITKTQWNPKRVDAIEALEKQSQFFLENNYKRAWRKSIYNILWVLSSFVKSLKKCDDYKKYYKFLKRKLKVYLRLYKKELCLSKKNSGFFFEAAYPIEMRVYWNIQGVKNHFTKKLDKNVWNKWINKI